MPPNSCRRPLRARSSAARQLVHFSAGEAIRSRPAATSRPGVDDALQPVRVDPARALGPLLVALLGSRP